MKGTVLVLMCAASLPLAACASTRDDTLASAGTGASVGAAAGAGLGAATGAYDPITGAVVGAAVGGLAGAYWADKNGDGYADGYVNQGQYYQGQPAYASAPARNCPSTLGTAATGAGLGAAAGAGAGALLGGVSVLEGALVGAAVGGIAGAVWADHNNDGCVDGYVREGQYYEGGPVIQSTTGTRSGERG
jgi:hypothetical protein